MTFTSTSTDVKALMDKKAKQKVLDIVKNLKLQQDLIPDEPTERQRKWYVFGAYDALRMLSQEVMDLPEPKKAKTK